MITAQVASPANAQGAVLKAEMYQGQWGYLSGGDAGDYSGEVFITPVSSSGTASYHGSKLCPIQFIAQNQEDKETYMNSGAIPSGTRVIAYVGDGVVIEDDYVYTRVGSGTYISGTIGDAMYLNTSGYPVVGSGATYTSGETPVAIFLGVEGTSVRYQTITAHSGIDLVS